MITTNPHAISRDKILKQLHTDRQEGLSDEEAKRRSIIYGTNILPYKQPKKPWVVLLEQFLDPVIYILGSAVLLAMFFDEWLEAIAVLAVILITVSIGYYMELRAVRSIEALKILAQTMTSVLRQGAIQTIQSSLLVPGDVIILTSGDVIPADARLITCERLATKEASLTGESNLIEKQIDPISVETDIGNRSNMVFKGTIVSKGDATAVITGIGSQTVIGEISQLAQLATKETTPLEKKLRKLTKLLICVTVLLVIIIGISGYIQGKDLFLMLKTGIALAVAAIPEGLPIVTTITLARGMVKLANQNVLIKTLEAVQTLGETTIICSDKTGTLTENKMAVHELVLPNEPSISFHPNHRPLDSIGNQLAFNKLIEVAVLCNNAVLGREQQNKDAIEIALVQFAEDLGFSTTTIRNKFPELVEVPFDEIYKQMATLHKTPSGYMVCVKGAAETVIDACTHMMTAEGIQQITDKEYWRNKANAVAETGLRILAFADREVNYRPEADELIEDLTLLGFIGFLDPPRKDVRQALQIYRDAGVKVVMITGDHPATARHIAEDIGLMSLEDPVDRIIGGSELSNLEEAGPDLKNKMMNALVFARMLPKQKLELVNFYQHQNEIVGMLGDGVNDAPALKKADIGIAMGTRGTEVAKEIADVILLDDQFTSTELAIRQGRTIFQNIRHFVMYLISCNLAEIISVAIASLSNLPLPLLPLQILFLNLVTDVFPALALGMGKGIPGIMKQAPRDPKEPILTKQLWVSTVIYGLSITFAVIGIMLYANYELHLPSEQVNNMAFYTLVLAQLLNVFNIPHRSQSFFVNEVTSNIWVWGAIVLSILIMGLAYITPVLQQVLSLIDLSASQFLYIGLFAFGALIMTQVIKRLGGTV